MLHFSTVTMDKAILKVLRKKPAGTIFNFSTIKDGLRSDWESKYKSDDFKKIISRSIAKLVKANDIEEVHFDSNGRIYKKWKLVPTKVNKDAMFPEIKRALMYYLHHFIRTHASCSVHELRFAVNELLEKTYEEHQERVTHQRITAILYSWSEQDMPNEPWTTHGGSEGKHWRLTPAGEKEVKKRGYHEHETWPKAALIACDYYESLTDFY